jgi:Terminase large subunit, T4likevirus-type, N-terminal
VNPLQPPKVLLKPPQWTVFNNDARFRILVAGRRFGKTYLSMVELCRAAWPTGRLVWYVAPTYRQAKRIVWKPLKQMTRPYWATQPNETDLRIELVTGGTICLRGADNYDSLRGDGLDFLILDEYACIAKEAWPEVLRPALADRQGHALFIGTPRGHDHFYDLYEWAENQPNWARFQFTTEQGGNVSKDELQAATHELDERTYRQEFQASFENLTTGRAYFAFDSTRSVERLQFNPKLPLFWSLDFNVNPMCSVIGQRDGDRLHVLAELALADSNTAAACEQFLDRIGQFGQLSPFTTRIHVYGDATGSGRQTSASRTDWQIVRDFFKRYPYPVEHRVPSSNPPVKDRVNCVNAMLCNQAGERRLSVHPDCRELILDLERVRWKSDASGNLLPDIDKSDPARSHASDALGYLIARDFGMRGKVGEMPGLMQ